MNLMSKNKISSTKYQDIVALAFLLCSILFFAWKARYSFGISDESLYISNTLRLIMGDSLLVDDWHVSQLTGFFLYLPAKAYISIAGSTEGIILFFRYLFIALQSVVFTAIYFCLKKYGIFSIFAALLLYLHIPFFTLMSPGYYSLGLAFVALSGLLMATAKKHCIARFYIIGLLFACAVLCNPVLAFVYILFSVCMIVFETTKKKDYRFLKFPSISFEVKTWLWITMGVSTMAIIFIAFILSRTTVREIIVNFPMLLSDPEYTGAGAQSLFSIQRTIMEIVKINPYLFVCFVLLMIVIIFDKRRLRHRKVFLAVGLGIFFIYVVFITYTISFPNFGYWMFPLAFLGLLCYVLSEKKHKNVFVFLWILGVLYALCLDVTSDMGFVTASQGLLVSDIASTLFIKNIIDELREQKEFRLCNPKVVNDKYSKGSNVNQQKMISLNLLTTVLTAALVFQIGQECFIAADLKYCPEYLSFDSTVSSGISIQKNSNEKLNVELQTGPEKGLKTTTATAKIYNGIINDLSLIKEKGDGNVLIAGTQPWCYLYLDMPYASFSARFQADKIETEEQRLTRYYELHTDKIPRYIYVPKVFDINFIYIPDKILETIITEFKKDYELTVQESDVGYSIEIINR